MEMETYPLASIAIGYELQPSRILAFGRAELVLITDYGDRSWYIDIDGITDAELLGWFGRSENIRVDVRAADADGKTFCGSGFFHPNERHQAAAIRGEGELKFG